MNLPLLQSSQLFRAGMHFLRTAGMSMLALVLSAILFVSHASAADATGIVSGKVINKATGIYLVGAEVKVAGTDKVVYTDVDGSFEITGLAPGPVKLVVEYIGLDVSEIVVEAVAGQRVTKEIELSSVAYSTNESIVMTEFVVAGEREGRAAAITQQRNADNMVNVVSSDEFPNTAGGNLGDFLRNMSGLSIEYSGADPRSIRVRGMDPNMTSVTVDGMRSANAASSNTNRTFEIDQISIQSIESIEYNKAATPAMDADSAAGGINMVSKSAFKTKGRRISYQLMAFGNSMDFTLKKGPSPDDSNSHKLRPGGSISYSEAFLDNRLGVAVNANFNEFYTGGGNHNVNYVATASRNTRVALASASPAPASNTWNSRAPNGDYYSGYDPTADPFSSGGAYAKQFTYGVSPVLTQRTSLSVNLDYKLTESTTLWMRNQVNTSLITGGGRSLDVNTNDLSNNSAALRPSLAVTNSIQNGWTDQSVTANGDATSTVATAATSTSGNFAHISGEYLDKSGVGTTFAFGSKTKVGPWKIDTAVSSSLSTNHYRNHGDMPIPQVEFFLRGISYRLDTPYGSNYPMLTQTAGPDIYNLSNYVSNAGTGTTNTVSGTNVTGIPSILTDNLQFAPLQVRNSRRAGSKDNFVTAKVDVRRDFSARFPFFVQSGLQFRQQNRYIDRNGQTRWNYAGPDGRFNTGDERAIDFGQFTSTRFNESFGPYRIPYYDLEAINAYFKANRNQFIEDTAFKANTELSNQRSITETVEAAYAMGNIKFGRIGVLTGLRYERTTDEGKGPIANNTLARDVALADANAAAVAGGFANWASASTAFRNAYRADATKIEYARFSQRATSDNTYDNFYPNIQTRTELTQDLLLRTSFNKTIARQNFGNIMPGVTVTAPTNTAAQIVQVNNPALKPVYFNNYDVGLEYYTKPSGKFTLSYFYKDIRNYTVQIDDTISPGIDYDIPGFDPSGYIGSTLRRLVNSGKAKQAGIEFEFYQPLTIIADCLNGFNLSGSYTYQKGVSNTTYGGSGTTASNTLPLVNVIPKFARLGLSYRGHGFNGSLNYNWRSDYANSINSYPTLPSDRGFIRYTAARGTLDVALSYDFYRRHSVFVEAKNITNEARRDYMVFEDRIRSYNVDGAFIYFGIKGTF